MRSATACRWLETPNDKPRLPPACSFFLSGRRRDGPPAPRTWCFKARKSLFLRREAPRPCVRPDFRRRGRGASWSANPYSFVGRHHVLGSVRAFGASDVVLQDPQNLVPSSGSTTLPGPSGPSAPRTWCFIPRKTLFLRREAPRPWVRPGLRRCGRGDSCPAKPYSFVGRHHVPGRIRDFNKRTNLHRAVIAWL